MSNNEKSLFWICVILTMAMAFSAMMISLPRNVDTQNPTRLDYQGTIITAFSVIVAVLLGWQIYSAIGIEKRMFKIEKRVERLILQLNREKNNIKIETQSAEDYSSGINRLSVAMIEYIQTKFNNKASLETKAKHYCTCYMVSASAITYLLESKKKKEVIEGVIELCVEGIDLSARILFHPFLCDITKRTFSPEDHSTCDDYYKLIMQMPDYLGIENINIINKHRSSRLALL